MINMTCGGLRTSVGMAAQVIPVLHLAMLYGIIELARLTEKEVIRD
jgi:hypothetical protein